MMRCRPVLLACALAAGLPVGAAAQVPTPEPGYSDTVQFGGLTQPTALAFSPDGRTFVAEKRGVIQVFDSPTTPVPRTFADLRTLVHNFWDRGLLGLALPPGFPSAAPWVYVLYTYDAPPGGTAPTWGAADQDEDTCPTPPGATDDGCVVQGRLSRLGVDGTGAWSGTEEVLVQDWCQQFPSHSIGALRFGPDGMLYASGGEGGNFVSSDWGQFGGSPGSPVPPNPCGDPPGGVGGPMTRPTAEGGALRAQQARTVRDRMGAGGAIVRLDPSTGLAAPGNPMAGSSIPGADRLVAFGFRNPFRFALRPGTNDLYVGDVGWSDWEEVDHVPDPTGGPVQNFGWPCFEGPDPTVGYRDLGLDLCDSLYLDPAQAAPPFFTYPHAADVLATDGCGHGGSSISGLAFQQGTSFPASLAGALFVADYARRCIWAMPAGPDGVPDPARIQPLVHDAATPVDLQTGLDGDLYYVDISGGTVHRVRWTLANHPPIAVATATPDSGPSPLQVRLDGSGSGDPDPGDTLTWQWDLDGDGVFDRTGAIVDATFPAPGTRVVRLRVTDARGLFADATVTVDVDNTPPVISLSAPAAVLHWSVGDVVAFQASATDLQDGSLPAGAFDWTVRLHHCEREAPDNCHEHVLDGVSGVAGGSFVAPDHEWPCWLEVDVTATDSLGASDTASVRLDPATATVGFATDPPGLLLDVGGAAGPAPFFWKVVASSLVQATAPPTQALGGTTWEFLSWSDGGDATHSFRAVDGATLTARYVAQTTCGDVCADAGNPPGDAGIDVADAPPEAPPEAATDDGTGMPPDVAEDLPADGGTDVPADAAPDLPSDAAPDLPADAAPDLPADDGTDAPRDAAADLPVDAVGDVPATDGAGEAAQDVLAEGLPGDPGEAVADLPADAPGGRGSSGGSGGCQAGAGAPAAGPVTAAWLLAFAGIALRGLRPSRARRRSPRGDRSSGRRAP